MDMGDIKLIRFTNFYVLIKHRIFDIVYLRTEYIYQIEAPTIN